MERWVKVLLIFQSIALIVLVVLFQIQKTEAGRLKAEAECQADLARKSQAEAEAQAQRAAEMMAVAEKAQMEAHRQAELAHTELVNCLSKK